MKSAAPEAPRIVEIAQLLLAEVTRNLLWNANLQAQILIGQVLESHFAAASNIQRNRPISLVSHRAVLAAVVEERANDIGIEEYLGMIPIIGAQLAVGQFKRQLHGRYRRVKFALGLFVGGGAIRSSPPPCLNYRALDNLPLRIDGNGCRLAGPDR